MIKFNNKEIKQIYLSDESIQRAVIGNKDGTCTEVFLDRTVPSWADATGEQLKKALERHRAGIINLYDDPGWQIGSERKVQLSEIYKTGMKTLTGTTWVFKGRKSTGVKKIDTDSLPDYTDGEKKWNITFQYYKVSSGGTTKATKKKDPYKEWIGSYNGLAKDTRNKPDSMCYITEKDDGSYTSTLVFYNTKDSNGNITSSKWAVPSKKAKYKSLTYYKISGEQVLSPYQEIKITGGEDVQNEELMEWLKQNAICTTTKFTDAEWTVAESHESQEITLVLAHKANEYNGSIKGFELATGSDNDDPEVPNQKPVFIVCQKEVLNTTGKMMVKTKSETKTINGKKTTVTTEVGSNDGSWGGTSRRAWCNRGYYLALPKDIRDILQSFVWQMGPKGGATGLSAKFTDTIALPLERHVYNTNVQSTRTEFSEHETWEYYDGKSCNKAKNDGTLTRYWTASPAKSSSTNFVCIQPVNTPIILDNIIYPPISLGSNKTAGLSPFMII